MKYQVEITEDNPDWIAGGVHEDTIIAGINAYEKTQEDLRNYISGETADWDDGMIVAYIFKEMVKAEQERK